MNVVGGQGFPLPFQLGNVGHDQVRMHLRVEITRRIVGVGRRHHFTGGDNGRDAVLRQPGGHQPFDVVCSNAHGFVMRGQQCFITTNEDEQRDAFRRGKRQVVPRPVDVFALHVFAQLGAVREFALQHAGEVIAVDRPFQPQLLRALA